MTSYSYTISGNFGGTPPKYSQLHTEIVNEIGITTTTLLGIESNGDNIDIIFESSLSAGEITVLNNLISNYVLETPKGLMVANISVNNLIIDSIVYNTIASFNFPGTSVWKNITHMKIIGFMEENGTSYDVKIYDVKNNKQICLKNLTSTDENIYDLGILTNLPMDESIFELRAKVNGVTIAYIKNLNIYHD